MEYPCCKRGRNSEEGKSFGLGLEEYCWWEWSFTGSEIMGRVLTGHAVKLQGVEDGISKVEVCFEILNSLGR